MSHFVGCWRFIRAENLDELLKTLKVNEGLRKLATVARPRVIIRMVSVKELEVASITDCVTVVEQAIFDEEFTEITADGRVVTSTFTKESESKMRKVQKHADLNTVVQYEVQGDELTTVTHGEWFVLNESSGQGSHCGMDQKQVRGQRCNAIKCDSESISPEVSIINCSVFAGLSIPN